LNETIFIHVENRDGLGRLFHQQAKSFFALPQRRTFPSESNSAISG
jgi:hypothetical protein